MTTRLAIIDLDGIIANADARFAKAEETKQYFLTTSHDLKEAANVYWRAVFYPEHIALDTLIAGADEAIAALEKQDYMVIYLTSRPEHLRAATQAWLSDAHLYGPRLVMKPPAAQFIKTVAWKALTIQTLATWTSADELLVVDDEPANLAELLRYEVPGVLLRTAESLVAALSDETKPGEDSDALLPF